jgi:hypothetical protein
MTVAMDCWLVGRWRIVEADLWARADLDLVAPAMTTIGADGHGEIAVGAMQACLELEYRRNLIFFTWAGFEEGAGFTGSGSAELTDHGTIEIAFAYHLGDEAVLKAERASSSTAC